MLTKRSDERGDCPERNNLGQTCNYMGVDFLDFLRSGEKDIHAFAESRRGRRRRTQTKQATDLPANAIPDGGGQY